MKRSIFFLITILSFQFVLAQKTLYQHTKVYMTKYLYEEKNQGTIISGNNSYKITRPIKFRLNSSSASYGTNNEHLELYIGKKSTDRGIAILKLQDLDIMANNKTLFTGNIYLFLDNNTVITCIERENSVTLMDGFTQREYLLNKNEILRLKKHDIVKMIFTLEDFSHGVGFHNSRKISADINDEMSIQDMCPNCDFDNSDIKNGETSITVAALFYDLSNTK